jgi:hypothetical protein
MKKLSTLESAFTCEKLQIASDEAVAARHRTEINARGPGIESWLR